ncbi:MAG: Crp/Fnr family transcriptional regulator [Prolixibacteraceae bacterium]|nr:Crp/Fnr family transcriptional regulator [Prolixibacteraceae bacterium]
MESHGHNNIIEKYSDSLKEELNNLSEPKEISKGNFLFKQGELCQHLYYIKKGLVRVYYYSESGKEITVWFSAENTIITAIDSFYNRKPTRDNCEALEDLEVYSITYSELEAILSIKKGAEIIFYILYEVAHKMADFMESIRFQTAEERYKLLIDKNPAILQRASLGQIASYLGITQETLSRIRSNK